MLGEAVKRGRATRVLLGCAIVGAVFSLVGCTANVSGRVLSDTTGKPIAGATVLVAGKAATTDKTGSFSIESLPRGKTSGAVRI